MNSSVSFHLKTFFLENQTLFFFSINSQSAIINICVCVCAWVVYIGLLFYLLSFIFFFDCFAQLHLVIPLGHSGCCWLFLISHAICVFLRLFFFSFSVPFSDACGTGFEFFFLFRRSLVKTLVVFFVYRWPDFVDRLSATISVIRDGDHFCYQCTKIHIHTHERRQLIQLDVWHFNIHIVFLLFLLDSFCHDLIFELEFIAQCSTASCLCLTENTYV